MNYKCSLQYSYEAILLQQTNFCLPPKIKNNLIIFKPKLKKLKLKKMMQHNIEIERNLTIKKKYVSWAITYVYNKILNFIFQIKINKQTEYFVKYELIIFLEIIV